MRKILKKSSEAPYTFTLYISPLNVLRFFKLISTVILIKESDIKLIKLRNSNIKTLIVENVIAETDLKWKKKNKKREIYKIVVPGRLVISQKNQLQALDILKDLHSIGLNVSITFMGKGTDLNLIKQKSNETIH